MSHYFSTCGVYASSACFKLLISYLVRKSQYLQYDRVEN